MITSIYLQRGTEQGQKKKERDLYGFQNLRFVVVHGRVEWRNRTHFWTHLTIILICLKKNYIGICYGKTDLFTNSALVSERNAAVLGLHFALCRQTDLHPVLNEITAPFINNTRLMLLTFMLNFSDQQHFIAQAIWHWISTYVPLFPSKGKDMSPLIPPQQLCPMTRMFGTCRTR